MNKITINQARIIVHKIKLFFNSQPWWEREALPTMSAMVQDLRADPHTVERWILDLYEDTEQPDDKQALKEIYELFNVRK